jgi:hypothetical protein
VYLGELLDTAGGRAWWDSSKGKGFAPQFVADVDAVLAGAHAP